MLTVCDDWTPEQVRGFRLLANRSANWAEWDLHAVAEELAELQTLHFDLSLTGFDGKEIDELPAPRADEQTLESVPEKPQVPVSVPGDLWLCGAHHVLCGDATDENDVKRALGEISDDELRALHGRIRPGRTALRYFDQLEWDA